jgi:hypothetical protein
MMLMFLAFFFQQLFQVVTYFLLNPCPQYGIVEGRIQPELGQLAPDRSKASMRASFLW